MMKQIFVVVATIALIILVIAAERGIEKSEAQSPKDIAPYKIAELPEGSVVYKLVHQGCELFVVERYHVELKYGNAVAASITTGRGCK